MNLKNLDVKALAALQSDIEAEMQRKKREKKKEVVAEVKALLARHGMTLDDLPRRAAGKTGARAKVKPKYRNKKDPNQTWSGRGRKPRWVVEHLDAGGKMKDIEI